MAIKLERFIQLKVPTNLRPEPNLTCKPIGLKPAGLALEVLADGPGTWYKVRTIQGTIGYVTSKSEYVEPFVPQWLADARKLIEFGDSKLNVDGKHPYVLGSDRGTETSFDCSDFVRWCYKETLGIVLGADSRAQARNGEEITKNQLQTGDTVHFDNDGAYTGNGDIDHVAFYVAGDRLLHTYNNHCNVNNSDLKMVKMGAGGVTWTRFSGYWADRAVAFRRHIKR